MKLGKLLRQEWELFEPFRKSPALHFHLLQAVALLYVAWRFASRDMSVYGWLTPDAFQYPDRFILKVWPQPLLHWTTFQFIYSFLPRPNPAVIEMMQYVVVTAGVMGSSGILPRLAALVSLVFAAHLDGMLMASNAETHGETLALCALIVLVVSPREAFYRLVPRRPGPARSEAYQWPLFLFFMVTGAFYTFSGLNKLVDVGLSWPFSLHLEKLAVACLERAMFLTDRYASPQVCSLMLSPVHSVLSGFITLLGELGFISILFFPRRRLFFVASMIALHLLVFLTAGINFLGSSALLLLCMDWNALVRRLTVEGGPAWFKSLDWFGRLESRPPGSPGSPMRVTDENGRVYEGVDALAEVATRCPVLYPVGLLLRVPGARLVARELM